MTKPALTTNRVISRLIDQPCAVIKTFTRVGTIYAFGDNLRIVPTPIAERLIEKNILVSAGDDLVSDGRGGAVVQAEPVVGRA
ncbi:MAG: hypothetical protein LCH88_09070 [Proteobacteria bacterium]|nr:hypothetical protein [Pseudomonadota bacterium]